MNVIDYGSRGVSTDDTDAVRRAHDVAMAKGVPLQFGPGRYEIRGWTDRSVRPFRWVGNRGTTIVVRNQSIDVVSMFSRCRLVEPAAAGATEIVADGIDLVPGAILYLQSAVVAERIRSEPITAQTVRVLMVRGTRISIDRPLNFAFYPDDPGLTLLCIRKPREVAFSNINFVCGDGNRHSRSLTISGCAAGMVLEGVGFRSEHAIDPNTGVDGVMVQQALDVTCRDLRFSDCRYGMMVSRGARGVSVTGLDVRRCRHGTYPAFWAYECGFSDIVGRDNFGTFDSHSAFDIVFSRVRATGEREASTMRASGASLVDASISYAPQAIQRTIRAGYQIWTDANRTLASKRDITVRRVHINYAGHPPSDHIAFFVGGGRKVTFEDVQVSSSNMVICLSPAAASPKVTRCNLLAVRTKQLS